VKPRGVPHGFYKAGTGMVRVMEILTPGESFDGYVNGYEALASRSTSDDEHKEARSELGKRYGMTWHDEMVPEIIACFSIGA